MSSDGFDSLAELFSKLKFRRQIIGGLSEADVWKKLEEVQTEYRRLYDLQAAGYEARLKEREERIRQLKEQISMIGGNRKSGEEFPMTGGSHQPGEEFSMNGRSRQPGEEFPMTGGSHQQGEQLFKTDGSRNEL